MVEKQEFSKVVSNPIEKKRAAKPRVQKHFYYLFKLKSSKGFNACTVAYLPDDKQLIKAKLEDWCSRHSVWDNGSSTLTYSYSKLPTPKNRTSLLKKYTEANKKYEIAKFEQAKCRALLNCYDLEKSRRQ